MTTVAISEKQKNILNAVKQTEQATVANIAKFLGITAPAVTGTMAGLKKNGLVTIEDGVISLTTGGTEALGAQTAEQRVEAATTSTIETPSIPKAQQAENGGPVQKAQRGATPRTDSKASKAQAIFDAHKDDKRSVLMDLLMNEAGLTKNGANTYIYNMRKKAGMVTPRGTTAVPETPAAEAAPEVPETPVIDVESQETVENQDTSAEGDTPATE